MNLIDWILNLAALFLWIDWRSGALARRRHSVLSLASAVRPAERRLTEGWGSFSALLFLLAVRPSFYYSIGAKLGWTPQFDLLAISLPWRSDLLGRMYLFSTFSFLLALGSFYSVLLLLSAVNRGLADSEVMQQFVRLQLGWLEKIPWYLKPIIPSLAAGLAWIASVPLLVALGILPPSPAPNPPWGQALALALASFLTWKWLLVTLFLLHWLNIYVYLGSHPIWPYISGTARKLLLPLSFLSFPRFDLAPPVGVALVFCATELALKPAVLHLFQKFPP